MHFSYAGFNVVHDLGDGNGKSETNLWYSWYASMACFEAIAQSEGFDGGEKDTIGGGAGCEKWRGEK